MENSIKKLDYVNPLSSQKTDIFYVIAHEIFLDIHKTSTDQIHSSITTLRCDNHLVRTALDFHKVMDTQDLLGVGKFFLIWEQGLIRIQGNTLVFENVSLHK